MPANAPVPPAHRPIPPRRKALFAAVLFAAFTACQEVLFRLAFPSPEVTVFCRNHYTRGFSGEQLEREARRDGNRNLILRVTSEPDGYTFDHTLNLYGFRGPTFRVRPPADRRRVLFVGDSFVEGMGAADPGTIPAQFARLPGVAGRVEALNLGVSGTGLPEFTRLIADAVPLLRPDTVILCVYANDLPPPPYTFLVAEPGPLPEWNNLAVPRVVAVIGRLSQGRSVPRFFPSGPFPYFEPVPSPNNPLSLVPPPPGVEPAILDAARRGVANPALLDSVRQIAGQLSHDYEPPPNARPYLELNARRCRDAGVRLVVAYIPYCAAINRAYVPSQRRLGAGTLDGRDDLDDPRYESQQRHLAAVCQALGQEFVDLTPAFRAAESAGRRLYWPVDGHCNADGYRLAAEVLARAWLVREIVR